MASLFISEDDARTSYPEMLERLLYVCAAAVVASATFQYGRIVALALRRRETTNPLRGYDRAVKQSNYRFIENSRVQSQNPDFLPS